MELSNLNLNISADTSTVLSLLDIIYQNIVVIIHKPIFTANESFVNIYVNLDLHCISCRQTSVYLSQNNRHGDIKKKQKNKNKNTTTYYIYIYIYIYMSMTGTLAVREHKLQEQYLHGHMY